MIPIGAHQWGPTHGPNEMTDRKSVISLGHLCAGLWAHVGPVGTSTNLQMSQYAKKELVQPTREHHRVGTPIVSARHRVSHKEEAC